MRHPLSTSEDCELLPRAHEENGQNGVVIGSADGRSLGKTETNIWKPAALTYGNSVGVLIPYCNSSYS